MELVTMEEGTDLLTRRAASITSVVARYYDIVIGLDTSGAIDTLFIKEIIAIVYICILVSFG